MLFRAVHHSNMHENKIKQETTEAAEPEKPHMETQNVLNEFTLVLGP